MKTDMDKVFSESVMSLLEGFKTQIGSNALILKVFNGAADGTNRVLVAEGEVKEINNKTDYNTTIQP
jgi:hypothetical protein